MVIPILPSSLACLSYGDEGLHSSGYASGVDLLEIVRTTGPGILISVHTKDPGYFLLQLAGRARGLKCRHLISARRFLGQLECSLDVTHCDADCGAVRSAKDQGSISVHSLGPARFLPPGRGYLYFVT